MYTLLSYGLKVSGKILKNLVIYIMEERDLGMIQTFSLLLFFSGRNWWR